MHGKQGRADREWTTAVKTSSGIPKRFSADYMSTARARPQALMLARLPLARGRFYDQIDADVSRAAEAERAALRSLSQFPQQHRNSVVPQEGLFKDA